MVYLVILDQEVNPDNQGVLVNKELAGKAQLVQKVLLGQEVQKVLLDWQGSHQML